MKLSKHLDIHCDIQTYYNIIYTYFAKQLTGHLKVSKLSETRILVRFLNSVDYHLWLKIKKYPHVNILQFNVKIM